MSYPESEPYVFKPLNERVPVYQKPFTLVQFAEAVERALGSAGSRSTPSP